MPKFPVLLEDNYFPTHCITPCRETKHQLKFLIPHQKYQLLHILGGGKKIALVTGDSIVVLNADVIHILIIFPCIHCMEIIAYFRSLDLNSWLTLIIINSQLNL